MLWKNVTASIFAMKNLTASNFSTEKCHCLEFFYRKILDASLIVGYIQPRITQVYLMPTSFLFYPLPFPPLPPRLPSLHLSNNLYSIPPTLGEWIELKSFNQCEWRFVFIALQYLYLGGFEFTLLGPNASTRFPSLLSTILITIFFFFSFCCCYITHEHQAKPPAAPKQH